MSHHVVNIDLSAKVEQWTQVSAVVASNGITRSIRATGKVKQELRSYLAAKHGAKSIQYRAFALLIYVVVKDDLSNIRQIVIDQDYSGQDAEATIKNLLLAHLRQVNPKVKAGFIRFANVKGTTADTLAREIYQGKADADRDVSWKELEEILKKKDKAGEAHEGA